jgi:hypothetical protein
VQLLFQFLVESPALYSHLSPELIDNFSVGRGVKDCFNTRSTLYTYVCVCVCVCVYIYIYVYSVFHFCHIEEESSGETVKSSNNF